MKKECTEEGLLQLNSSDASNFIKEEHLVEEVKDEELGDKVCF